MQWFRVQSMFFGTIQLTDKFTVYFTKNKASAIQAYFQRDELHTELKQNTSKTTNLQIDTTSNSFWACIFIYGMIPELQQIACIMHAYEKQNFLRVCFDHIRGLRLHWDFKDLSANERYFRHIFIICSEKTDQTLSILDSLYKKMKLGDLFCCIYPHDSYIYKIGKWVEKSLLNSFKPERYFKQRSNRSLDRYSKTKIIQAAGKEALQFDEPVIINFLGIQTNQLDFYKNEVIRHRISLIPCYQYIVNFFGDFEQNNISIHSGINLFKTDVPNFIDHADYYHKMINGAAVQTATIEIIALNGQLSLFNENYWKNTDFNRISATYYGPSSRFDTENIHFLNRQQKIKYQHQFEVRLKIKLFQSKVLQSFKRIKINFLQTRQYCPTLQANSFNTYFHQKNIFLTENPNRCEFIVKYRSNKYESDEYDDF